MMCIVCISRFTGTRAAACSSMGVGGMAVDVTSQHVGGIAGAIAGSTFAEKIHVNIINNGGHLE